MSEGLSAIRATLERHGQQHVLVFHDELDASGRQTLIDQVQGIDFARLDGLIDRFIGREHHDPVPDNLEPARFYPHEPPDAYDAAHYRRLGQDLIRAGKVAAFCVAGGQATRLGWSGPKGTFPGTVVTGKPLFRVLAEQLVANRDRYRTTIPFYIMTSPLNDASTRSFMQDNNCFGLNRRDIFMFPQGLLPSLDARTGRLLLADKGTVAMHPDGHGGSLMALAESGALDDMASRGIEHISYFQVDNPLVKVLDPLFIGLHAHAPDSSAEISSKMVAKIRPDEKVGVFCNVDGKARVIEYSRLPETLAHQRDESGELRFRAGSIAVHIISVEFVRRLTTDGLALPLHPANKVVAYIDPDRGEHVVPKEHNAVKLESLVLDALTFAR